MADHDPNLCADGDCDHADCITAVRSLHIAPHAELAAALGLDAIGEWMSAAGMLAAQALGLAEVNREARVAAQSYDHHVDLLVEAVSELSPPARAELAALLERGPVQHLDVVPIGG